MDCVHVFGVLRNGVEFGFSEWRKGLAFMGYGSLCQDDAEQALDSPFTGHLDWPCGLCRPCCCEIVCAESHC